MKKTFKIVVIEDSETSSFLLKSFFEDEEEYEIFLAATGLAGIEAIEKNKPDLVLLDLMLPDIDGFEVLKRLRSTTEFKKLPVIIVSAKDHSKDIIKGKNLGAIEYITKPIGVNKLFEKIEKIIKKLRV